MGGRLNNAEKLSDEDLKLVERYDAEVKKCALELRHAQEKYGLAKMLLKEKYSLGAKDEVGPNGIIIRKTPEKDVKPKGE